MKKCYLFFWLIFVARGIFAQSDYTDENTGIIFPAQIANLQMLKVTDFEAKEKGLGVGINYFHNEIKEILISVYAYNLNMKDIGDGADSEAVKYCYEEAESQIFAIQKKGIYKKVKKISTLDPDIANSQALKNAIFGSYSFKFEGNPMISNLWVTGYKNNFIKIRFSYPLKNEKEGKEALVLFMETIKNLLK